MNTIFRISINYLSKKEAIDILERESLDNSLTKLCEGRFSIIFTKNKKYLKAADLILVFKSGAQVEKGNYEELISKENGIYSSFLKEIN